MTVRQITFAPHGHILTHCNVWSPDGRRIVYDVRSDPAGSVFDGTRIETVDVETGEIRRLYESRNGACCGAATFSPVANRIVFIHGPEFPDESYRYGPSRRRGVMVDEDRPGVILNLDALDRKAPFTPGALRGGSHVHVFSGDGRRVSFTYDDDVVHSGRNVGVSVSGRAVQVPRSDARNHDGAAFSVLVTETVDRPEPGSDQIGRAYEDAWVGNNGRVIAFLGDVVLDDGRMGTDVFVVELPADPTDGADAGTQTRLPRRPRGVLQRRLTCGGRVRGPRHWVRSSGTWVGFLSGNSAQLWVVSAETGDVKQVTQGGVQSAFTWHEGSAALVMDGRVCVVKLDGSVRTLSPSLEIRPEACVFSPDGKRVAFVMNVDGWNQIFIAER